MRIHNIELVEEQDSGWMYVPHGQFFVCVGKKEEVLKESASELGRRVLDCLIVAEYHTITNKHRRKVQ